MTYTLIYWPFAPVIWDYINRAMPYDQPGYLSADEVYAERIRHSLPEIIDSYDELVRSIPEHYRIVAPPRAGEIGVHHGNGIIHPDLIAGIATSNRLTS